MAETEREQNEITPKEVQQQIHSAVERIRAKFKDSMGSKIEAETSESESVSSYSAAWSYRFFGPGRCSGFRVARWPWRFPR